MLGQKLLPLLSKNNRIRDLPGQPQPLRILKSFQTRFPVVGPRYDVLAHPAARGGSGKFNSQRLGGDAPRQVWMDTEQAYVWNVRNPPLAAHVGQKQEFVTPM